MRAYIDGSSKGIYGYVITTNGGNRKTVRDHPMTNNQAEWLALLVLLMELENNTEITILSDSQIVVNQFTSTWETKNETLKHLKEVCLLIARTKRLKVNIGWVPRNENVYGKYLEKLVKNGKKKKKEFIAKLDRGFM